MTDGGGPFYLADRPSACAASAAAAARMGRAARPRARPAGPTARPGSVWRDRFELLRPPVSAVGDRLDRAAVASRQVSTTAASAPSSRRRPMAVVATADVSTPKSPPSSRAPGRRVPRPDRRRRGAPRKPDGRRTGRCDRAWVPRDYFGDDVAARYDEGSAEMFDPEVLGPTVDLLAELAGDGGARARRRHRPRSPCPSPPEACPSRGSSSPQRWPSGCVPRTTSSASR